ncbi:MAG: DNA mismatch repair endonuclease MutL [Syntrophomonadaceae bacterium]|nr:DNA mismatch repair endonuclease MutL [Syntrophomonadaceae bacterium]
MSIRPLDDNLINKIAAGEVIERPASVVKELIENSIDAAATIIAVNINRGGIDKIEVEDNGQGMETHDIPLAFQRHATSKISSLEDLFNINTMGFRGEALPSIASISRIDVYSQKADSAGIFARLEGGRFLKQENRPGPVGTRIIVSDLFFNTPARRSFLKSAVTEGNHVYDLLRKYALSRPDISFSFSNDKKQFFKTPGNGNLKDTVLTVFGRDFASYLTDITYMGEGYTIEGLISTPELRRTNRKNQYFFVNHRPVRSVLLYKAVDQAYQGFLLSREQPAIILSLKIPPESVDVNVHPQKSEVRFKDEKSVFRTVHAVLKEALEQVDYRPLNYSPPEQVTYPSVSQVPGHQSRTVYETGTGFNFDVLPGPGTVTLQPLNNRRPEPQDADHQPAAGEFRIIGQCLNSYILMEMNQALYLVDQHAAHERIMYNQLKEVYNTGKEVTQLLAVPLALELSPGQIYIIENHNDFFADLGFDLDVIAPDTVLIRATPGDISGQELDLVNEILELWQDNTVPNIQEEAIKTLACKKAIKAGEGLYLQEMERIIKELLHSVDYKNCPHGRPTIIKMSQAELDRLFKR